MCLIVHKLKTDPKLTYKFIEDVHWNNADGWGIGIFYEGETGLKVYRGIEDTKKGPKRLWNLINANQDKEMIIHFRMKTHGAVSEANVHPFEVAPGIYLMHNGVISAPDVVASKSDTWHFSMKIIKPLIEHHPNPHEYIRSDDFKLIVEHLAGRSNRLAVFDKDGVVKFCLSNWSATRDGTCVSNTYAYTVGNPTNTGRAFRNSARNASSHGATGSDWYGDGCGYSSHNARLPATTAITPQNNAPQTGRFRWDKEAHKMVPVVGNNDANKSSNEGLKKIYEAERKPNVTDTSKTTTREVYPSSIEIDGVTYTSLIRNTNDGVLRGVNSKTGRYEAVYKKGEDPFLKAKSDAEQRSDHLKTLAVKAEDATGVSDKDAQQKELPFRNDTTPDWDGPSARKPLETPQQVQAAIDAEFENEEKENAKDLRLMSEREKRITQLISHKQTIYDNDIKDMTEAVAWVGSIDDLIDVIQLEDEEPLQIVSALIKTDPGVAAEIFTDLVFIHYEHETAKLYDELDDPVAEEDVESIVEQDVVDFVKDDNETTDIGDKNANVNGK